jgi:hypothetical protein
MNDTMPREEHERYARAFYYAVVENDLQFAAADKFADWWCHVGWVNHRDDIAAGLEWYLRGRKPSAAAWDDIV